MAVAAVSGSDFTTGGGVGVCGGGEDGMRKRSVWRKMMEEKDDWVMITK